MNARQPFDVQRGAPRRKRWWLLGLAAVALPLVFLAYVQPSMLIAMTDAIWSCF